MKCSACRADGISDGIPVGVPISVIIGLLSSGTGVDSLFLHDTKKVPEKSIIANILSNILVVFIIFRWIEIGYFFIKHAKICFITSLTVQSTHSSLFLAAQVVLYSFTDEYVI